MGIISRGTGTRLMIDVLSVSELVPVAHASVKKLNGTRPQSTKTGNPGVVLLGKILVNTNVNAPIITSGFNRDQNTPRDRLRYLSLKSFWIPGRRRKRQSPCHPRHGGRLSRAAALRAGV